MAYKFKQLYTKPDARTKVGPKGRQVSIAISSTNLKQNTLDTLDEYANQWEVSRSEAFWRMVKAYSYADMTGSTIQEANKQKAISG